MDRSSHIQHRQDRAATGASNRYHPFSRPQGHGSRHRNDSVDQSRDKSRRSIDQSRDESRRSVDQSRDESRRSVDQSRDKSRRSVDQSRDESRRSVDQSRDDSSRRPHSSYTPYSTDSEHGGPALRDKHQYRPSSRSGNSYQRSSYPQHSTDRERGGLDFRDKYKDQQQQYRPSSHSGNSHQRSSYPPHSTDRERGGPPSRDKYENQEKHRPSSLSENSSQRSNYPPHSTDREKGGPTSRDRHHDQQQQHRPSSYSGNSHQRSSYPPHSTDREKGGPASRDKYEDQEKHRPSSHSGNSHQRSTYDSEGYYNNQPRNVVGDHRGSQEQQNYSQPIYSGKDQSYISNHRSQQSSDFSYDQSYNSYQGNQGQSDFSNTNFQSYDTYGGKSHQNNFTDNNFQTYDSYGNLQQSDPSYNSFQSSNPYGNPQQNIGSERKPQTQSFNCPQGNQQKNEFSESNVQSSNPYGYEQSRDSSEKNAPTQNFNPVDKRENKTYGDRYFYNSSYSHNASASGYNYNRDNGPRGSKNPHSGGDRFHPYNQTVNPRSGPQSVAPSPLQDFRPGGHLSSSYTVNQGSDPSVRQWDRQVPSTSSRPTSSGGPNPFFSSPPKHLLDFGKDNDDDDDDEEEDDDIDDDDNDDEDDDSGDEDIVQQVLQGKKQKQANKQKGGKQKTKMKDVKGKEKSEVVHVAPFLSFADYTTLWENEKNQRLKKLRLMACKASVSEAPRSIAKISDSRNQDCNLRIRHRYDRDLAKSLGVPVVAHLLVDGILASTSWGKTKVDAKRAAFDEALRALYMPYLRVFTAPDEHRELHASPVPFHQAREDQILKPKHPMAPLIIEHTKYKFMLPRLEKRRFKRYRGKKNKNK